MPRVALCWGCGIGSLLALQTLRRESHDITLVHIAPANDGTLRAVPPFVVAEQAACLALPLHVERAGADGELAAMTRALDHVRADAVAFGYLRGEDHMGMFKVANASRSGGAEPMLPIRHLRPDDAAHMLARSGHRAFVRATTASAALVGRFLDPATIDEIEGSLGRSGWASIRSLTVDGSLFTRPLQAAAGDIVPLEDGWRLDISLRGC